MLGSYSVTGRKREVGKFLFILNFEEGFEVILEVIVWGEDINFK